MRYLRVSVRPVGHHGLGQGFCFLLHLGAPEDQLEGVFVEADVSEEAITA